MESAQAPARGPRPWPLSVAAYHALGELGLIPEKTELLHGQVFPKIPKSPLHRFLCQRLLRLLQRRQPAGCFVWQEQPITCGDSELEPDLSVIRGNEDQFANIHPATAELVIEVCVTGHEYDRSKLRAYAGVGVKECWLVLGPERQIEVHQRPTADGYAESSLHGPDGRLSSIAIPGFEVDLDTVFGLAAAAKPQTNRD